MEEANPREVFGLVPNHFEGPVEHVTDRRGGLTAFTSRDFGTEDALVTAFLSKVGLEARSYAKVIRLREPVLQEADAPQLRLPQPGDDFRNRVIQCVNCRL
jgi:hypothetical protein